MTRNLGGRTVVGHDAAPVAIIPPIPTDQAGGGHTPLTCTEAITLTESFTLADGTQTVGSETSFQRHTIHGTNDGSVQSGAFTIGVGATVGFAGRKAAGGAFIWTDDELRDYAVNTANNIGRCFGMYGQMVIAAASLANTNVDVSLAVYLGTIGGGGFFPATAVLHIACGFTQFSGAAWTFVLGSLGGGGSASPVTRNPAPGDVVRVEYDGVTRLVTGKVNGATISSFTLSSTLTHMGGAAGIDAAGAAVGTTDSWLTSDYAIDNLEYGALVAV